MLKTCYLYEFDKWLVWLVNVQNALWQVADHLAYSTDLLYSYVSYTVYPVSVCGRCTHPNKHPIQACENFPHISHHADMVVANRYKDEEMRSSASVGLHDHIWPQIRFKLGINRAPLENHFELVLLGAAGLQSETLYFWVGTPPKVTP